MEESRYGKRDERGYWRPFDAIAYPPMFNWPFEPGRFLRWVFAIPGYLFPWNALYVTLTAFCWFLLTPDWQTLETLQPSWVIGLLLRNTMIIGTFVGLWHWRFYQARRQGSRFKFNGTWPADQHPAFLFGSQTRENMFWTFVSAVPVWTAYEALMLWCFANGWVPGGDLARHPAYFIGLMLLIPIYRDLHFYLIHRLIHWPPLYRTVHKLHHKNINPGPWSGLSMHPVEHVLYFSCCLVHFVVPSHPLHALFTLFHAALTPAQGHVGFDKIVTGNESAMDTHSYAHYLHHRHFDCNYADGVLPLDRWFGTFNDGSGSGSNRSADTLSH